MNSNSDVPEGEGPTSTPKKISDYYLSQGSKVEVCAPEEDVGVLFPATVLVEPPPGERRKIAVVRYEVDSIRDFRTGLRPIVALRVELIRPPPPPDGGESLVLNDVVDAYHGDCWFTGFVARVEGDRYTVAFMDPPDVFEIEREKLRAHLDWVGSHWVKTPQKVPSSSLFCLGSEVEFDIDKDKPGSKWMPAVSLGQVWADHFKLKYKFTGNNGEKYDRMLELHVNGIRSRPPPIERKSFELLEKVEAFCGSCWSGGSITRYLEGDRYTVTFKDDKKEMDFNHTDLRPHLDWIDSKWVTNLKLKKGTQEDAGKTENNAIISAEERGILRQSKFRISWPGERKRKRLSKSNSQNLQSSNTRINAMDDGLSKPAGKESLEQTLISLISRNASVGDRALVMQVEETNSLINIDDVEPKLPFVKSSPVWHCLESTDQVFIRSPQNPHFRPLLNHRENDREGMAVGYMVNFSALIGEIYKMQEDNSRDDIDKILERLVGFEELGFNVKVFENRLKGMQEMRIELEKVRDELKGVRSEIEECTDEITIAIGKVNGIDKEIEKLKRERAELMFGSVEKQSKRVRLKSEADVMDARHSCAWKSLRDLVNEPW